MSIQEESYRNVILEANLNFGSFISGAFLVFSFLRQLKLLYQEVHAALKITFYHLYILQNIFKNILFMQYALDWKTLPRHSFAAFNILLNLQSI